MGLRVQQQGRKQPATSPNTGPTIETPRWGSAAPWMGPRTPSNHLRGPVAPRGVLCVLCPRDGVRALANLTPKRPPKRPRMAPGSGMGAGGVRCPCFGTESTRATCGVPFTCGLPAPNDPKRGPMAPGHAPLGVWWPYLGTESTRATCGLPFGQVLPVFLP